MSCRLLLILLWILVLVAALGIFGEPPLLAQAPVLTFEEMKSQLSRGDAITVVRADGKSIIGSLRQFGDTDLTILTVINTTPQSERKVETTIPHSEIRSIERERFTPKKATAIGAGVGAGFALTMFAVGYAGDANEIGEYGGVYIALGAITTGVGALVGTAIDHAHTKPHVRFEVSPETAMKIRAAPLLTNDRRGVIVSLTF